MVSNEVTFGGLEQSTAAALAASLLPAGAEPSFDALRAFDAVLAGLLRAAREPLLAQMRLTWWHDAVLALGSDAEVPAHPALIGLAAHVVPAATADPLRQMVVGWEELLAPDPLGDDALERYALGRGGGLFRALGSIVGWTDDALIAAGANWALCDLAANCGSPALATRALDAANANRRLAFSARWPLRARPLGVLALLDRADAPHGLGGLIRVIRFRATGLWREPPPASLTS